MARQDGWDGYTDLRSGKLMPDLQHRVNIVSCITSK